MVKEKTAINLANALSVLRMLLGPVFMILVFNGKFKEAFGVILIATLTDFLDGKIARIWNMQTRVGKMLDPLADKVIVFFAIVTLLIIYDFPVWIGILIILRDLTILIGGTVFLYRNRKRILVPNMLGKITTFIQMVTIVVYIISVPIVIKYFLLTLTVLFTVLSAVVYFIKGHELLFTRKKERVNLANKITLMRIALIPIFIIFLLSEFQFKELVAASIFIILALSDALDGYIARKRKQITNFGKLVDPLADKLLVSAALVFLIGKGVEAWMAYTIIAREFIIMGLRLVAVGKKIVIPAKKSGKLKTIAQIIGISAVLLNVQFAWELMLVAVLITIYSGLEYLWAGKELFKDLA